MSVPSNTYLRYTSIGVREDLANVIYDISPTDTPIMSSIGKAKATQTNHEWQTDALAAATTANALIEGDDAAAASLSPTTRVAKAASEIKRDIETIITANQAKSNGTATSGARVMGSLLSYITSNVSKGSAGTNPTGDGSDVRSDTTTRTFLESMLKDVAQQIFEDGGTPKMLVVPPGLKATVSGFTGVAEQRYVTGAEPTTIVAAAGAYLSDFGLISIVPDRFMRSRDALMLDSEYAALAYLRPFQTNDLAKTGDSEKTQILAELTLEVRNEKAHGGVFDIKAA